MRGWSIAAVLLASTVARADNVCNVCIDLEEAAKQQENPLSGVVNLQLRNTTSFLIGPNERSQNIFRIGPTLPLRLGSRVTLNTNVLIPLVWNPDATTPHDSAFGMGDITLNLPLTMTFKEILFVGLGPTMRFPTATDNRLGAADSGQFSLGPTATVEVTPGHWVMGMTVENWWSVAGRDSGSSVKALNLTPILTFNLPLGYYLTASAPIIADFTAPFDRWLVPWGGGVGQAKLFSGAKTIGIAYEVQAFWNVVRPVSAALWQLRFQVALFFPRLIPRPR
jgi:hypothetical protein